MRVRRLLPLSRLFLSTLAPVACNSFLLLRPGSSGVLSMSTSGGGGASSSTCKEDIERGPLGAGMTRSKVAVVGAGIAGSSLARTLADAGADVTVFEMGRGAGGRMSTRKPRDMPGLSINHGVPVFCAQKPAFMEFIEPLVAGGAIVNWKGTYCEIDAKTGGISQCEVPGGAKRAFAGSPDMSSVCERLLDVDGITKKYQSQVVGMSKEDDKWALTGPKEVELGHFDWLCVTSHTMGHPRWTSVFGSEPPLTALAGSGVGDAEISQLVSPLASVASSPVMICMVSFSKQDEGARGLMDLPFDIAHINGHPTVSRVVRQVSGDYVTLVVHSTHSFAADNANVYGSTSAAAKLRPEKWGADDNKAREEDVLGVLYAGAQAVLKEQAGEFPKPVYGPLLHRWGSAFCSPAALPLPAVSQRNRLALCGDFCADAETGIYFGVESATLSAIQVAKAIIKTSKL